MQRRGGPSLGPLAHGIARILEARIRSGIPPVGRALPSEREIAGELQVSRGVVRAALQDLVERGMLVHKPHHRPVVAEQNQIATATRNLGTWLWPNSSHFSAGSILKGIQSVNLGRNTQIIVASGAGEDWSSVLASEREFLEDMAADPATLGVILWYLGGHENLQALRRLRDRNIPIVFVDRMPPEGFDVDYVGTNNSDSATQAVQHLIALGHRKIALLSNIDPASSVAEREDGYRRALSDAGIPLRDEFVQRATYDSAESVASSIELLLAGDERPTSIFCINDQLGLQAYDILLRLGLRIPEEISVVGFDGLLRWAPGGGYLTTMRQDFERIGRMAATLVKEKSEGRAPAVNRHYFLDAPLSAGASSGPPPTAERFFDLGSERTQSSSKETMHD